LILPRAGLEQAGLTFVAGGRLRTVGDLIHLRVGVAQDMPLATYMQQVYPIWLHPRVDLQDHQTAQDVVAQLISAVDPAWIAAAEHADPMQLLAAPSTADIATQLRDRYS